MEITTRNRSELKSFFVKNAIPTEVEFADLIEGMVNQKDDGFAKLAGSPLSIEASGDEAGQKKAINLYKTFSDANPNWVLSLNPRSDPATASTAKAGFSISDHAGNSRFFIDESTGKVGLGTVSPIQNLDVNGRIHLSHGVIQRGGAAITDTDDLGLYSQHLGQSIRLVSNEGPIRFYTDGGKGTAHQLSIESSGAVAIPGTLSFGRSMRQMLNLWDSSYGVGVQGSTQYFRTGQNFAWFKRGEHHNNPMNAGTGGTVQMVINDGKVGIGTASPIQDLDVNGRIHVNNGVIQSGGDAITDTSDLGLYSQNFGRHIRIVSNTAPIRFFTDGVTGDDGGIGTVARLSIESNGDVFIPGTLNTGTLNTDSLWVGSANTVANIGCYDFKIGHPDRRGSVGRALVDRTTELFINYGADWPDGVVVQSNMRVTGTSILKQEDWQSVSFENSWQNHSSSFNSAGYFKDSLGIVHLKGRIKGGSVGSGKTIFNLPTGYRPTGQEIQLVSTSSETGGHIDVATNGNVYATEGSNNWFSLDGITFRAA